MTRLDTETPVTSETTDVRSQRILFRQQVAMRDGVHLCTDVYLPPQTGARPTVVVRTPYGRHMQILMRLAKSLNNSGCAVVMQDCRGRYQSEGVYALDQEEPDGIDTLAWIAEQDWCNGKIGLYGTSIAAHPNYFVATSPLPDGVQIRALVSVMGSVSHHAVIYRGGALLLHWALPWAMMMDRNEMGKTNWSDLPWQEVFAHLPTATTPESFGVQSPFWPGLVSHPARGHWSDLDATPRLQKLTVPTLHLTGWQDFMLGESIAAYREIAAGGAPQKLVVGPWDHRSVFTSLFAKSKDLPTQFALVELIARWFERWLGDDEAGSQDAVDEETAAAHNFLRQENGAILYVEEDGRWLESQAFPLAPEHGREETFFLSSTAGANSVDGDGELTLERPSQLGRDLFRYDPDDPVPTTGGGVWPFPQGGLKPGPADQSDVEQRHDVLVYTTDKLSQDLYVAGPVTVELWASSSAQDTDFTAKLVDVDVFGVPRIVQDAILRGRFADSPDHEKPRPAHRPHLYEISLHSLVRKFKKGHRLRLEISSSNFPKYDRHLNVPGPLHLQSRGLVAEQTVHHGGPTASCLKLRVLERHEIEAHELKL